jgi:protocatechuate 3,4-dioxygenase beta subunit
MTKSLLTILIPLTIIFNGCVQRTTSSNKNVQSNNSQATTSEDIIVGGPCDRCDEMFYDGKPSNEEIENHVTIANETEPGERMEINGSVYSKDGKSPARDVTLYLYHTNANGLYAPSDTQTVGRVNGHLRNWVKTDSNGHFKIYSIRPAPYPNRNVPAHIHIIVKEVGKIPYYVDEVWFDDDKLITPKLRNDAEKRGGDLIVHVKKDNQKIWKGNLKITLGLNIPDYK